MKDNWKFKDEFLSSYIIIVTTNHVPIRHLVAETVARFIRISVPFIYLYIAWHVFALCVWCSRCHSLVCSSCSSRLVLILCCSQCSCFVCFSTMRKTQILWEYAFLQVEVTLQMSTVKCEVWHWVGQLSEGIATFTKQYLVGIISMSKNYHSPINRFTWLYHASYWLNVEVKVTSYYCHIFVTCGSKVLMANYHSIAVINIGLRYEKN